jgi:protein SCO1/2
LYEYKQIASELGEDSDQVVFTFITVDPQRDTPEQLKTYVQGFNSAFIGLTGTEDELEKVYDNYGVYREVQDSDSAAGYLVDHTARIYVLDQQGQLKITFPFGMDIKAMTDDIRHLLDEG